MMNHERERVNLFGVARALRVSGSQDLVDLSHPIALAANCLTDDDLQRFLEIWSRRDEYTAATDSGADGKE